MISYTSSIEIKPISHLVFMTSESAIHVDPIHTQHRRPLCMIMITILTALDGIEVIRQDVHVTGSTSCHGNRNPRSSSSNANTASNRCSSRDVCTHQPTHAYNRYSYNEFLKAVNITCIFLTLIDRDNNSHYFSDK